MLRLSPACIVPERPGPAPRARHHRGEPVRPGPAGLGRSFQDARLFPGLTVSETIALALERFIEVGDPLSAAFRLPANRRPRRPSRTGSTSSSTCSGSSPSAPSCVGELSTGSRRMVDLACVVAHAPDLVLLDEPSSGIAQREAEALGPVLYSAPRPPRRLAWW